MVTHKLKHSIYTHFTKNLNYDTCLRTKITRVPCRRRNEGSIPRAEKFDDLITADHKVLNEGSESRNNHRYAVVVQDLATQWIQSYPCKSKNSQETEKSLRKFVGPSEKPKVFFSDNSLEFGKSRKELSWNHRKSPPYRSETNGMAERAIPRVREETSAVLLRSGLDDKWWSNSMECHCYLRNVQDLVTDGKTPYERRFQESFQGSIIPCGALVEYLPNSERDKARIHQVGKKVLPGISLEFALIAGGIWKGDILIVDIEELEKLDASEIYPRRLNAKEVLITHKDGDFVFPVADGSPKLFPRTHSETGIHRKERESQRRSSRR